MKSIHFRSKVILLSVLPILAMSVVLTALSIINIQQLGDRNVEHFTQKVIDIRREELRNYMQLAMSAVNHIYDNDAVDKAQAQHMAKSIFRDMNYGEDGYFFVYDYEGNNIVHPKKPHLEGQNLWYLRDSGGVYIIRSLVREAKNDLGGYTHYVWEKPSVGREVDKMGFSMGLNDWRWMIGTGLYMDDISGAVTNVQTTVQANTKRIALLTFAISLFFTCCVTIVAVRFTMSQGKFASYKLQKLSRACVIKREMERIDLAANLNGSITEQLQHTRKEFIQLVKGCDSLNELKSNAPLVLTSFSQVMESIGDVADGLHPKVLVGEGLYTAVDKLAQGLSKNSGIKITTTGVNALGRLPLEAETACYRIAQEALENVMLHSNADNASVRMRQSPTMLSMTIQDDGLGFDPDHLSRLGGDKGTGLAAMELQTELLNGAFTLFAAEGTGVMNKITNPLC